VTKVTEKLGFKPTYTLEDVIKECGAWCKELEKNNK
jgi:nucleoside-diphosphate-sugar epimerase